MAILDMRPAISSKLWGNTASAMLHPLQSLVVHSHSVGKSGYQRENIPRVDIALRASDRDFIQDGLRTARTTEPTTTKPPTDQLCQLVPSGCGAPPIPAPLPIFANDFGVSQFNVTLLNGYGWYFDTLQLYRRMNGSIHFVTDFGTVMNNRAEVGTKLNVNLAKLPGGTFAPGEELIFAIHVCKTGPKDFEGCNETQGLNACVGAGCNNADTCGTGCTMISDIGTCTGCGNCGGDIGQCNGDVFYFSGLPTNNIDNVTHVNVVNDGQPTVYLGFEDCRPPSGNCGDICYEDFQFKLDFIDNESITPCPNVNCDDGNPCTNDQRRMSGHLGAKAR
eukprot:gene4859-34618_t